MAQGPPRKTATRLLLSFGLVTALFVFTESAASAQAPYYGRGYGPGPGRYAAPGYGGWYGARQHAGFHVRLCAGLGYLGASEDHRGSSDHYSGIGGTFSAALGGAVAPNLIVYGELLGTSVINAEWSRNGYPQGWSGLDVFQYGFGPGVAYYFEPINLYLSGTLAFTRFSFSDTYGNSYSQDTNLGVGASFTVGKEWWVGSRWGIGLAGHFQLASMGDPYVDARLRTLVFSLLFSASFG